MCLYISGFIIITDAYDERNDIIDESTKSGSLMYNPIKAITTATIPAFEESTIVLKKSFEQSTKSIKKDE